MLGLKILFYVVAVFLALVFLVAFMNSTSKDRPQGDRYVDVLVGVVVFFMFIVLVKVFGGFLI